MTYELKKYCKALFKKTKKQRGNVLDRFDEEAVHQFRVEVKRLTALAHLIGFYQEPTDKNFSEQIKKVFGKNGELRDLQMLQNKLKEFPFDDDASEEVIHRMAKKAEHTAAKKLKKHIEKSYEGAQELEEEMLRSSDTLPISDFSAYFTFVSGKIMQSLGRSDLSEKEYHELRKHLKELKYNLKLLDSDLKKSLQVIPDEKELTALEVKIGEWHDCLTASELISQWMDKKDLNSAVIGQLKKMNLFLGDERERLFKLIKSGYLNADSKKK